MKTLRSQMVRRAALTVAGLGLILLLHACTNSHSQSQSFGEATGPFASPEEAVNALVSAVRAEDLPRMLSIMGPEGKQIVSSADEAADRQRRQTFIALYDEKHSLQKEGDDSVNLLIGNSDWPFPVPLVREDNKWHFDSEAGLDEILNRRIGENELSTIQVCKAIGDAQQEYALRDPEGTGLRPYARRFVSDPGKRNGLYWPAAEGEETSPLGELAAGATAEGYQRRKEGPTPYHGYYFRILDSQGPSAPNGAIDYAADGNMTLGFALIAYPAEYGSTGIMTFEMGPDGVVYQKDLGEKTGEIATAIKSFDPGEGWKKVE